MGEKKLKNITLDLLADIVGSFLISIGIYNFATASGFPVTGVSGIAQVLYFYFGLPIGSMTTLLNLPIILICGRVLGVKFMAKSFKTLLIANFFMDVIAPLFPIYKGELILSSICMGLFAGLGYALIFLRDSSTGGLDFVTLTIHALKPQLSLGKIITVVDCAVLLICGLLMGGEVDKIIYGLLAICIAAIVVDKVMGVK